MKLDKIQTSAQSKALLVDLDKQSVKIKTYKCIGYFLSHEKLC